MSEDPDVRWPLRRQLRSEENRPQHPALGALPRGTAAGTIAFCVVLFAIQTYTLFGTPPTSMTASAITAIIAYFVFALVIWCLEDRRAARYRSPDSLAIR